MAITQQQARALEALDRVYYATHASFIDRNLVRQYIEQGAGAAPGADVVPPEILAIGQRLHTQDNRITQDPLFAVQQKRRIYGVDDGYHNGVVWLDDEGNESPDGGPFKRGSRKVGYIDIWEFVTGCFTEQGCKDYIARNGHNLHSPRIYAYGSYRNDEFIGLRKWLMELSAVQHPQQEQSK